MSAHRLVHLALLPVVSNGGWLVGVGLAYHVGCPEVAKGGTEAAFAQPSRAHEQGAMQGFAVLDGQYFTCQPQ
jgi:hypothetical protein